MFEVFPGYNTTPMTDLAMQLPMFSHGTPYALDWNDDGVLDLWHHNHFAFSKSPSRWSDPSTEIRGPRKDPGGCMVDWDAVLRDDETGTWYAANNGDGFIEWTDGRRDRCFDVHSTAYLDIDGDGIKDLFLVTGGGRGLGHSWDFDNILFWGEKTNSTLGYKLVGGKGTARLALLDGRKRNHNERGRHQYWFDVNGDGLLDILFLNEERNDSVLRPGQIYLNGGNRTFTKVKPDGSGFAEFARMAVLTDMDGDGFAREFIVPSDCQKRKKDGAGLPLNFVCDRSPLGSISVYRRDPERLLVRESIYTPLSKDERYVKAIATGDFDSDDRADTVILWEHKVNFHLSLPRRTRCRNIFNPRKKRKCLHTLGPPDVQVPLDNCGEAGAAGVRFADFNLDGSMDMLVVCRTPGLHTIYEQTSKNTWQEMNTSDGEKKDLGELSNPSLMWGSEDFCDGLPVSKDLPLKNCHQVLSKEECTMVRYQSQYVICNMRERNMGPEALGATVADIDNDGYADIIMSHRYGTTQMYRNTWGDNVPTKNKFIALRLDRRAGAAATVGAVVKVRASRMGVNGTETTTQVRVISSLSHETDEDGGTEDRLVFGLGPQGRLLKIVVHWPNCCRPTVIKVTLQNKLWRWKNSMKRPYEVRAPSGCNKNCFLAPSQNGS